MWLSFREVIMVEKSLGLVASLMHLIILIMSLSLREVMMEAIMEVVQASVLSSMEMVSPMMWVVAKEKLTLKPVGRNSKLQPMATVATHGNGKLRIHDGSWPKVELLGSGSFGRMYKVITQMYSGTNSMLDPSVIAKIYENGKFKIYNSWQKVELLGRGSFGTVYEGITLDGRFLAAKEVLLTDQEREGQQSIYQLQQEISLLSQFQHKHIDQYYGTFKLCKLNDIKSDRGTAFWMAPEVINNNIWENDGYGFAADIWSHGCTVLEMLTWQLPYPELEPQQAMFQTGFGQHLDVPDSLMIDTQNFILACLQVDPKDRPTAAQLLEHPFVGR